MDGNLGRGKVQRRSEAEVQQMLVHRSWLVPNMHAHTHPQCMFVLPQPLAGFSLVASPWHHAQMHVHVERMLAQAMESCEGLESAGPGQEACWRPGCKKKCRFMALQHLSDLTQVLLLPLENTTKLHKDVMIESMFSAPAPGGAREYKIGPIPVCCEGFKKILGIGSGRRTRLASGGPDARFGRRDPGDPRGVRPHGFSSVYSHLWNSYYSIAEHMPHEYILASEKNPTMSVPSSTREALDAFKKASESSGPFGPGTDKLVLTPSEELPVKYLPPSMKKDHWWTYLTSQSLTARNGKHASYSTFLRVWSTCFKDVLRIRSWGKHSVCNTCTELKQKMHTAATHEARCRIAEQYASHLERTWRDRLVYWRLRAASQRGQVGYRDWLTIIIDGADQAKFRVMKAVAWPKTIEGEHRPQMKVVGALAHGHDMSFNFVEENVPKGSNLTIEVLAQCLERIISQSLTATPPHLWVQCDNAGGENKNRHLLRFLGVLVDRGIFRSCALGFLQVGHTHEDIDGIFGMMSKGIQQLTEWDSPYQMAEFLVRVWMDTVCCGHHCCQNSFCFCQ